MNIIKDLLQEVIVKLGTWIGGFVDWYSQIKLYKKRPNNVK